METYTAWLQQEIDATKADLPVARLPDAETLKRHYESRRELPITVSDAFTQDLVIHPQKHAHASLRTEYIRHYPQKGMAAHVLGYVSSDGAPPAGAILRNEPLWQRTKGATGLEAAFNKQLTGTDGTLCLMMADAGSVAYQQVFAPPAAGRDVVTTPHPRNPAPLAEAPSPSSSTAAPWSSSMPSPETSAPWPASRNDPNAFAGGISAADFTALTQDIDGPSSTAPSSAPTPRIHLQAHRRPRRTPRWHCIQMEFDCGPSLMIDGREFDNWSKDDHGFFNARAALIRSCNTSTSLP